MRGSLGRSGIRGLDIHISVSFVRNGCGRGKYGKGGLRTIHLMTPIKLQMPIPMIRMVNRIPIREFRPERTWVFR